jgi:peroxiredoxin Q/BCP
VQLVELQNEYERFSALGAEVVALSTETLQVSTRMVKGQGIRYPVLSDPEHRVIEAYGVYNLLGDHRATPSVFIVDEKGTITWRYVGLDTRDRPDTEVILEQLG